MLLIVHVRCNTVTLSYLWPPLSLSIIHISDMRYCASENSLANWLTDWIIGSGSCFLLPIFVLCALGRWQKKFKLRSVSCWSATKSFKTWLPAPRSTMFSPSRFRLHWTSSRIACHQLCWSCMLKIGTQRILKAWLASRNFDLMKQCWLSCCRSSRLGMTPSPMDMRFWNCRSSARVLFTSLQASWAWRRWHGTLRKLLPKSATATSWRCSWSRKMLPRKKASCRSRMNRKESNLSNVNWSRQWSPFCESRTKLPRLRKWSSASMLLVPHGKGICLQMGCLWRI